MSLSSFFLIAGLSSLFIALAGIFGPWLVLKIIPPRANGNHRPESANASSVSVIIPVHKHCHNIREKVLEVANQLTPGRDEIIVVLDGAVSGLDDILPAALAEEISKSGAGEVLYRVLPLPRSGKNAALNKAGEIAHGDILVISDRDARLNDNALSTLLLAFNDAHVGAACGHLCIVEDIASEHQQYWGMEAKLKSRQMARFGNITAATGSLLAVRKELYPVFPTGCADDMFVILHTIQNGYRSVFVHDAVVYSPPRSTTPVQVMRRQRRVVSGGLLSLYLHKSLLNPFTYGAYAIMLLCHKLLRRIVPLLLIFSACLFSTFFSPFAPLGILCLLFVGYVGVYILSKNTCPRQLSQNKTLRKLFWLYAIGLGMSAGVIDFISGKKTPAW